VNIVANNMVAPAVIWPRTKEDVNDLFERLEKLEKDADKAKIQREDSKLHFVLTDLFFRRSKAYRP
jgi:hypothetical protein